MALVRRMRDEKGAGQVPSRLDPGDKLGSKFPTLVEFLTLSTWEGGEARETGSVTIFLQDGCLKAAVSDKDAGLVAFTSAEGLGALLAAVDGGLAADTLDWRRPREQGGGRPGKRG